MSKIGDYVIDQLEKGNDLMYDKSQEPVYDEQLTQPIQSGANEAIGERDDG